MKSTAILAPLAAAAVFIATTSVAAQVQPAPRLRTAQAALGSAFTYQGQLSLRGSPVTDTCDFAFSLYDAASGGNQIGSTQSAGSQSVRQGSFAVSLDFGASAFGGEARWIETAVRCPAGGGSYSTLSPRQALTAVPNALYALSAGGLQGRPVAATAPSTGSVLRWDGSQWAPGAASGSGSALTRTLVVGPVGSEAQNGAALLAAIGSISGPSSTNPYLIKLEPGVYDLGGAPLRMREFVDVEGSGEMTTLIKGSGFGDAAVGTVVGANSSELRALSVLNSGGAANATAVYLPTSTRLRNVTIVARGGTTSNYAVRVDGASPRLTHVTAIGSGDGLVSSFGAHVTGFSTVSVAQSSLQAGGGAWTRALYASGSGANATLVDSELVSVGGVDGIGAEIEAGATGRFTNVRARAGGTTEAKAFSFANTTTTVVENSQGTVEESGASNIGLVLRGSSTTVRGSSLTARNGNRSHGILVVDSTLSLERSTVYGDWSGISMARSPDFDSLLELHVNHSDVTAAPLLPGIDAARGFFVWVGTTRVSSIRGDGGKACVATFTHPGYYAYSRECTL